MSLNMSDLAASRAIIIKREHRMRTKFDTSSPGTVVVTYEDPMRAGETIERIFTVRRDGERGYVFETTARGDRRQVCEGLASAGSTLIADVDTLPAVIRREHRRSVQAWRKWVGA